MKNMTMVHNGSRRVSSSEARARLAPLHRADRLARRRMTGAIAVAAVLHIIGLYWLTERREPVVLTSAASAAVSTVSVSLISAPAVVPIKPPSPLVKPVVPQPILPTPTKPLKKTAVLATHHASRRTVAQDDATKTPPVLPAQAAPIVPAIEHPAITPVATDAAQSVSASHAVPSGAMNKQMILPKAIDATALTQLGCHIPAPEYPARARRLGESGVVRVDIKIGVDGRFSDVRVASSSGFPELDGAAVTAIAAGYCEPYKQNGEAVPVTAIQAIAFNSGG